MYTLYGEWLGGSGRASQNKQTGSSLTGEKHEDEDEVAIVLSSNEVAARYEGGRCRKEKFFALSLVIRLFS